MDRLYAPWRMTYIDQPSSAPSTGCIFCDKASASDDEANLLIHRGRGAFVLMNLFPYNNGHLMVAPYRHTANLADLDSEVHAEIMALCTHGMAALGRALNPDGYNVGMNLGKVAGAGIADHLHLHIVPRWSGDTNFMPVLGETKVLPDSLENSFRKIRDVWQTGGTATDLGA